MTGPEGVRLLGPLTEWTGRVYEGVALTPDDRAVVEKLTASADDRLQIEELRRGLRVRTRSWVGVVRLPTVEIRVVPKVTGGQLGLVRLIEYASGLDALTRLRDGATLEASGDSLLELFALLFVEASERVLRRGLLSDYVEREDDLPMVRGRVLGDRQVLERFGQLDRIICRFDELEHDVVENQLLAAALQVVSPRVTSIGLQRRISRLRGVLEPICDTDQLDLAGARTTLTYNRLNAHYETAHQLAWLLLDALGIDDLFAPGETRSFSFLLNMNRLFERFVTRVVEQVLPVSRYRVTSQVFFKSVVWNVSSQRPYTNIIPDVLVERRGVSDWRVAIDAKYKLYDERGFDPSDIYQTFLYAFALAGTASDGVPTSLLLYPATAAEPGSTRLRIRRLSGGTGAEIFGIGLPIAGLLGELTASGEAMPLCEGLVTVIDQSLCNSAGPWRRPESAAGRSPHRSSAPQREREPRWRRLHGIQQSEGAMVPVMGEIRASVTLENRDDRGAVRLGLRAEADVRRTTVEGVVDTGAVSLVIPEEIATELGLQDWGTRTVVYADKRREQRPVTDVTIEIGDLATRTEAIVGPTGSEILIGQLVLEALDLIADCRNGTLEPRHPEGPVLAIR